MEKLNQIKKAQQQIQTEPYVLNYDDDTLHYTQNPIGKALQRGRGRPALPEEEKGKPSDRIICSLCKKEFVRSNRSHHKRTEVHKIYEKINNKLAKLILDN